MIEQPQQNQIPQTPLTPPPIPVAPIPKNKTNVFILGAVFVLCMIIFGIFYVKNIQPSNEIDQIPTQTEAPTPTPTPNVSRIATTSAFRSFSEEVASFSATLNGFNLQDSTLAPPALDLELGL